MAAESLRAARVARLLMTVLAAVALVGVSKPGGKPHAQGGKSSAHKRQAPTDPAQSAQTPTSDNRIMVYVISMSTPNPSSGVVSKTSGDDDAQSLVNAINNLGPKGVYFACSKSSTDSGCSADTATVFVSGTVAADGTVQLTSAAMFPGVGLKALGSASVQSASALSSMDASSLSPLLGKPQVGPNLQLGLAPAGYQQFVQLVPASAGSNVPDYSGMLIYLLSKRGITAFRSQMTIGAAGSNPSTQLCTQGEEYFLYSMNTVTSPHVLIGTTKLNAFISGAFLDCNDQTRNRPNRDESGFSGEASKTIPTTKGSALTYASLLAIAIPHLGWTSINSGIAAAGGFADMDPTSQNVQSAVAESALRNLVDNFCATQPSPSPSPAIALTAVGNFQPSNLTMGATVRGPARAPRNAPRTRAASHSAPAPVRASGNPGSAPTGNAGGTTVAFDPAQGAIGPKPYDPRCHAAVEPGPTPTPATTTSQQNVIQDAVTSFEHSMYPAPTPR